MSKLVNKDALARELGWSLPTLGDRIARDPDFPIVQRGNKGTSWVFDLNAAKAHVAKREAERETERAQREAYLASFRTTPNGLPAPGMPGPAPVSLEVPRRLEAPAQGTASNRALAVGLDAVADGFGREHGLPAQATADLKQRLAAWAEATAAAREAQPLPRYLAA